ncbi:MAG: tetratricopeptide repeat protein, partial [Planctomycetota bacterium]
MLAIVAVFLGGCRCPWSCTNTNLADSSRWFQSGIEAFNQGDHHEAATLLTQAVTSRPEDPILREHLADIYVKQGENQSAIEQLMQAADLSNQDANILVRIGNLYLENNQLLPATQYAKKALTSDRQLP